MSNHKHTSDALLGIVVLVGLLVVGLLVFQFGKLEVRFEKHYELVVEVRDATGIRKGVPVRLGGVNVGYVGEDPRLKSDFSGMELPLKIFEEIRIPLGSQFSIGADGLMGDRYIKITLPSQVTDAVIEPGTSLKVVQGGGIQALQSDAEGLMVNVNESVTEINEVLRRLDGIFQRLETILGDDNTETFNRAISDIGDSASNIKQASERLDPLLANAEQAVTGIKESADQAKEAAAKLDPLFASADEAVKEVKTAATAVTTMIGKAEGSLETGSAAIGDLADAVDQLDTEQIAAVLTEFRQTLASVDALIADAQNDDGFIKALMEDPKLKEELKSLISKLEKNGVIFYPRDRPERRPVFGKGRGN